jgi:anthranilate phosphoribosyltransferase
LLVEEALPATHKAEFLRALAQKGETVPEIAAFARELGARALRPVLPADLANVEILDVVGTGGDRLGTFNISTSAALVVAAAGVRVAKHGNRASTSPTGSADVLEALGVPHDLGPEAAVESLVRHHFAFFFAPKYHPAFRHIAPARRLCAEAGQTTIFNFLGPLLNPVRPTAMLVGVPRPELCEALAQVLQSLGVRRALVVCGSLRDETGTLRYLDEVSPLGETTCAGYSPQEGVVLSQISPSALPLQPVRLADLRGGERTQNAEIIRRILRGEDRGPRRDAVLLNAAVAIQVAGQAADVRAGWDLVAQVIDSGQAWRKLGELSHGRSGD